MGLNACHHGDYGGNLPPAAPTFTYHDPRIGYGKRINERYMAIDALAGTEHSFPRDERQIRQYRAGFAARVEIDRAVLGLEVVRVWTSTDAARCSSSSRMVSRSRLHRRNYGRCSTNTYASQCGR